MTTETVGCETVQGVGGAEGTHAQKRADVDMFAQTENTLGQEASSLVLWGPC